jgi:hypothetical protein
VTARASETVQVVVDVPRSALTIVETPRAVSQVTSERVLGLPRRPFLEAVAAYGAAGGRVATLGRLRLVDVDPFLAWLAARKPAAADAAPANDPIEALADELGVTP